MIDRFLVTTINRALETDLDSQSRITAIAGQRFRVTITDLPGSPSRVIEALSSGKVSMIDDAHAAADCALSGSSVTYLKVVRSAKEDLSLKGLHIEGDVDSAMRFAKLAQGLSIDWEGLLARRVGGFAARQVVLGLNAARGLAKEMTTRSKRVIAEAVVDELRVAPSRIEIEDHGQAIEALVARVATLEKALG